jgi:hypothetical protein
VVDLGPAAATAKAIERRGKGWRIWRWKKAQAVVHRATAEWRQRPSCSTPAVEERDCRRMPR